jgi:tRNA(Ile2) C34 agmatinyltransferase TiaS
MKFTDITKGTKVFPGEYILHKPTNQIVLCGAHDRQKNTIRALSNGKMIVDKVVNFQKIEVSNKERREVRKKTRCGRCGKK